MMNKLTNNKVFTILIVLLASVLLLVNSHDANAIEAAKSLNQQISQLTSEGYIDLSTWQKHEVAPGDAIWTVGDNGNNVTQSSNTTWPTFFYSDEEYSNVVISGKLKVETTSDDDFVGLVMGYQNPINSQDTYEMILWDWRQGTVIPDCGTPIVEMTLIKVDNLIYNSGNKCTINSYFWAHQENASFDILDRQAGGWNDNQEYEFAIFYSESLVTVSIDGVEKLRQNGSFKPGRIGFYNFSQSSVKYSDLIISRKLKNEEILTCEGEEKTCTAAQSQGYSAGINTNHGSHTTSGVGLQVPAKGLDLSFIPNFISGLLGLDSISNSSSPNSSGGSLVIGDELISNSTFTNNNSSGWSLSGANAVVANSELEITGDGIASTTNVAPSSGEYSLSMRCKSGPFDINAGVVLPEVIVISANSGIASTTFHPPVCSTTGSGTTFNDMQRFYLLEGTSYTVSFSNYAQSSTPIIYDNIYITKVANPAPLNTHILNGSFLGPEDWQQSGTLFEPSDLDGKKFYISFPNVGDTLNQDFSVQHSGVYTLELDCRRGDDGLSGSNDTEQLSILFASQTTEEAFYPIYQGACAEESWLSNTISVYLDAGKAYTLEFQSKPAAPSVSTSLYYGTQIDNVRLTGGDTAMGSAWYHEYESRLELPVDGNSNIVKFVTAAGNRISFTNNGNGIFTPEPGVISTLTQLGNNDYELVTSDQTHYLFNSIGQMLQKSDASGNTINFEYYDSGNGYGKLERAYQTIGSQTRSLTYTYDNLGRLKIVEDHTGREVELFYDNDGNVERMENPMGEATHYIYDGTTGYLTDVKDGENRLVKKVTYDAQGRATKVENGDGDILGEVEYLADGVRNVTQGGVQMTHTYNDRNVLESTTYVCPDGSGDCSSATNHDGNFRSDNVTDANSNTTDLSWSADGSNLEGVTNALNQTTSMVYDSHNNLTSVTNARSQTTQMFYENSQHPTFMTRMINALSQESSYTPNADGLIDTQTGIDGVVTKYIYNDFGQPTEMRVGFGTPKEIVTFYGYDGVGRLQTNTQHSPSGAFDDITTLTVYDNASRVIATIQNWQGTNPANWQANCDQTTMGVRDEDICSTVEYDDSGRPTKTTNTLGQSNLTFYDNTGRPWLSVTNWDGTTPNVSDPTNLCDWVNPDDEFNLCSQTVYDEFSRVVATQDPLGRWSRTEYDDLGRVKGTIANSVSVTQLSGCSFDLNRTNNDEDLCTENTYDAVGNLIETKDPAGRITQMFYDDLNRMEGQVTNASGTISSIADFTTCFALPADRDTDLCSQYEFDEVGNTIITTDPAGRKSRTFYDALNRVEATVANWDGSITAANQCVYGSANISYSQNIDTNICSKPGYDTATGRQETSTNALGQTSLTVYDEIGRPFISVANWDGTTTITSEANCSFPPAASDTNLCSVTYFDDLGRRSGSKDPMGNETDFAYDDLGRITTTTRYLQTSSGIVPIVSSTGFDGLGNRLTSTDADGYTVATGYDSLNRVETATSHEGVVSIQEYNALGWVTRSLDGLNHATVPSYDELGRQTGITNAENELTETLFDVLGNQVGMIDANAIRTSYLYDDLNRLTGVLENDLAPFNQPTTQQTNLPTDENNLTSYTYNVSGSQKEITNARGFIVTDTQFDDLERPIAVTNSLNDADSTIYDALGNVRTFTDRNGEAVRYEYDGINRPTKIEYLSDGEVVEFEYDAVGNRKEMKTTVGSVVDVTSYVHDTLYRITDVTDPFGKTVSYEYDKRGNRTKLIYPDNRDVDYQYDGDGRLEKVIDWNQTETIYGYDGASRLETTTLPSGVIATNLYDDANRLEKLTYTDSNGQLIADFDYTLDDVGNRVGVIETLVQPGAAQATTTFLEENGELVLEAESGNATAGGTTTHDWVAQNVQSGSAGNSYVRALPDLGELIDPNQLAGSPSLDFKINVSTGDNYTVWVRGMAPDSAGDSLHIAVDGQHQGALSGFAVQEWSWAKLNMSGGDTAATLSNGVHDLNLHMREDGLRIDKILLTNNPAAQPSGSGPTESNSTGSQGTHMIVYTYDNLYRLTNAAFSGDISANYSYTYDEAGNMLSFTETANGSTTTNNRTFNAMNQMVTDEQVGIGTKTITYDDNGNMTQIDPAAGSGAPIKVYSFNQRNMMTQAQESTGSGLQTVAEFKYDGNNDRLSQTTFTNGTASAIIEYTNDTIGLTQVLVSDGGAGQEIYQLYGSSLIGQQIDGSSQFQTYIVDGLGSVRVERETSGATNYTRTFSPFGETLSETGTSSSVYGYTGQQEDDSTGLIYLRARYYSAELKAFTAYDVWPGEDKRPQTLNHYAYVEGNPINFIDPTGNSALAIGLTVVAVGLIIYVVADIATQRQLSKNLANAANSMIDACINAFAGAPSTAPPIQEMMESSAPNVDTKVDPVTPVPVPTFIPPFDDDNYSKKVLVVGDGDFSYSASLYALHPNWNIVGTQFSNGDRYGSQVPHSTIGNLELFSGVDGTNLDVQYTRGRKYYDAVVFNNPHDGTGQSTANLIRKFKESAANVLKPNGEIHVNVTQRLLTNHSDSVGVELGTSNYSQSQIRDLPSFGNSKYYAPYQPSYTDGRPFRFISDSASHKNFCYTSTLSKCN